MSAPLLFLTLVAAAAPPETLVVPLRELIVTGTRVSESALRAPSAVSVVSRASFANGRDMSLVEPLEMVPGVFAQSRAGGQDVRITIRGYGARGNGDRSNAGNMRGIRVLTDGIPLTEPDGRTSLDLVDIGTADRVEIARSNASVLYGNASGGVVNLRTMFDFDAPFVRYEQRAGSFGFHREQGLAGFTLGRSRAKVSIANGTFGGWREHSESFATSLHARLMTPLAEVGRLLLLADGVSTLNRFPGALTAPEYVADPSLANPTYVGRDERRFNRIGRMAATLEHAAGATQKLQWSAWVEPKVLLRSERNRFRDFTRYHAGGSGVWSWERPLGGGVASHLSAGVDEAVQDGAILFYNLGPGGTRSTTVFANKREGANSAGAFVQEQIDFAGRWSVQLAGRYDNLWYISKDFIDPVLDATKHFTRVTPKATVSWRGDELTAYALLGGGVEVPAFNEIDPPAPFDTSTSLNPFLEPMTSSTYELGARGSRETSFGSVRYDAALYWIDIRNEVVPFNGGAYFFTAGQSRRRGFEAGLDWSPSERVVLRGSGTLSRNEYREYRNEVGDFAGKEVPGLPALSFAANGVLRVAAGFSLDVGVKGASRYYADDANTARTIGYGLVSAGLEWRGELGTYPVRAFVSGANLLDKEHVASVFINGVSGRYYEPGLPRNVSGGVSFEW